MDDRRIWRHTLSGILLCMLCMASAAAERAAEYSSDALKAAYLYRFPGYVDWPHEPRKQTFTIAVLGASGVVSELERMLIAQPIKARPARVRKINSAAEVGDAQVLFIGAGHSPGTIKRVIDLLRQRPILVVTDDDHGIELGGTINFMQIERRIRFEVSLIAAKRSGLTISSELLAVAHKVHANQSLDACSNSRQPPPVPCPGKWVSR